ncbi:MAG TPA: CBS domain-containing protein [Acidimicrobiales bacterium]|jgi:CBS domain-containing protein/sporulation protein YlmC with PRC-barrel domain|nr:CBS domain-containing protein [Acidimicrobiales bacterium]
MATPPPTSTPSRPRLLPGRTRDPERLPHQRRRRTRRILAQEGVFDAIVSLAGLLGRPVRNQQGAEIGRLEDVVARWADGQVYPPVSGLLIRVARRLAFVPASSIDRVGHAEVLLRSSRLDLRDVVRRSGEVLLARDVLDHQLVDVEGVQVIRAADLYLAEVLGRIRLVGADVSTVTLLRRLGPRRWRPRPTPDRVIDWAAIQPFSEPTEDADSPTTSVRLKTTNEGLHRLRPGELADLLEDLRRDERRELLAALSPDEAADALEEMQPEDLEQLLRESDPVEAAHLLAAMEPDEAVDALRDLPLGVRAEVLNHIPAKTALQLRELLGYEEDEAGGIMTTTLVTAKSGDKVKKVVDRLSEARSHDVDLEAVAVVDDEGRLVGDVTVLDLLLALRADVDTRMSALLVDEDVVTVTPHASAGEVAARLVEARRHSMVVLDDDGHPIGRILSDDVLDALVPTKGRFHFPRLLS